MSLKHVSALISSHADGNEALFLSVIEQISADMASKNQYDAAQRMKGLAARVKEGPRHLAHVLKPSFDKGLLLPMNAGLLLKDLVFRDGVRGRLNAVLAEQRAREELFTHGLQPAKRILLTGPPGTGKTSTALALAGELGLPIYRVELHAVIASHLGETATLLHQVFQTIAQGGRAVYLFDEFDALAAERSLGSKHDVGEIRRALNSLLTFLDDDISNSLIVAATNHEDLLDKAIFRRFDLLVSFKPPTWDACVEAMRNVLGKFDGDVEWGSIRPPQTAGRLNYSTAVSAATFAAKRAVLAGRTKVTAMDVLSGLQSRESG